MKRSIKFGTSALLALALACTSSPKTSQVNEESGPASKAAWIEKVAAALRNGEGIGPKDDMDALMAMSREEIVEKMMADPRFGDTVLSFNLFFLGRSVNQLKTPIYENGVLTGYEYSSAVKSMPQAMSSAHAVATGGDFYDLFNPDPGLLLSLKKPSSPDLEDGLPDAVKRQMILGQVNSSFDALMATFTETESVDGGKQAGCYKIYDVQYTMMQKIQEAGFDQEIASNIMQRWLMGVWQWPAGECYDQAATAQMVMDKISLAKAGIAKVFEIASATPGNGGGARSLADLNKMSLNLEGLPALSEAMTAEGFWNKLTNSSTNFNRKRSAYMLRTYFCDDLSPINVAAPEQHGEDLHGSAPACMACHYKLDPMGGLFRNNGQGGSDFSKSASLTFDDFKTIQGDELAKYMSLWKNDQGGWQVGYYVGAKKPHAKWQGDKLADLWPFMKQAPEVKQCLVRRMAEYFLGGDQVYDGGWLEQISKPLKAGPESHKAFKKVVASLVTSNTFSQSNPEPGQCYDFVDDGEDEGGARPPCEIAHIVKKRCATCHSDAEDLSVDFTRWVPLADGKYGFPHLNENGEQRTQAESFKLIMERITSADPTLRMPQGGSMAEMERQVIYKWLDKQLTAPN